MDMEIVLRQCVTCREKLGECRFIEGSDECHQCRHWHQQPAHLIPIKEHQQVIGQLRRDPVYQRYLADYSLRCAQFGNVNLRGVGHKD